MMTYEEAKEQIPDFESFRVECCNSCTSNDWYCPSDCEMLEKARKLDFDRILKCYAKHDGDLSKVAGYIKRTKINRKKGGY
jgi:hypothetical protein